MEDVLDLYAEAYDAARPVVCFDEVSKQLVADTRSPLPVQPGSVARIDYEYQRQGTCNLFVFFAPAQAWRHLVVTEHRTKVDFAQQMKWLVDERYPQAEIIRVVLDNLNTHRIASLYEAFAPEEARRIAKRLEFHHTPKHGSWLNMAEIEIGIFDRTCWDRRLADTTHLASETQALELDRNAARATVHWRFTAQDARTHLKRLYPSVSVC